MTPDPNVRLVKRRGAVWAEIPYEVALDWSADDLDTALGSHQVERSSKLPFPEPKKGATGTMTYVLIAVQPA